MMLRSVSGAALVAAIAGAASACGAARDEPIAESAAAVTLGQRDSGDRAVVALVRRRHACGDPAPVPFCTGTLIAPRVVLTAAHCLDDPFASIEVVLGASVDDPSAVFAVVTATALHPGYDATTGERDVALLQLADDPGVAPIALAALDAVQMGASARVVGFGIDETRGSTPGVKREGTTTIDGVTPTAFTATASPSMTCAGDSGGPVLVSGGDAGPEVLAGVTAHGDAACMYSAFNVRVDAVRADFIDPFVAAAASAPAGRPRGAIDLAAICGSPCVSSSECAASLVCVPGPTGSRCGLPGLPIGSFAGACDPAHPCAGGATCARIWPSGDDACLCETVCGGAAPAPPAPSTAPTAPPSALVRGAGCSVVRTPDARTDEARDSFAFIVFALAFGARRVKRWTERTNHRS